MMIHLKILIYLLVFRNVNISFSLLMISFSIIESISLKRNHIYMMWLFSFSIIFSIREWDSVLSYILTEYLRLTKLNCRSFYLIKKSNENSVLLIVNDKMKSLNMTYKSSFSEIEWWYWTAIYLKNYEQKCWILQCS